MAFTERCIIKPLTQLLLYYKTKKNTTLSVKLQNAIEKSQKEVKIETFSIQMHERLLSWLGVQAL